MHLIDINISFFLQTGTRIVVLSFYKSLWASTFSGPAAGRHQEGSTHYRLAMLKRAFLLCVIVSGKKFLGFAVSDL